jgi:putative (di)nucleoside polyphosphate hydrolase
MKDLPYRPAAGVMLINGEGKVWVGQRLDSTLEAWQMPQGGLDKGEEASAGRPARTGGGDRHPPNLVEIIACAANTMDYDLPEDLLGKLWGGKYRGQRQTWFLCASWARMRT